MQEIKKSYFYRRRLIGCEWICLTTLYYILDYVLTPPLRIRKKGNQGPFMTKQLSQTIMNRSKLEIEIDILNGLPEKTSWTIKSKNHMQ